MMRWSKWPWEVLETWGLSFQVVKTALAAGLSWGIAEWVIGTPKPYFAPLAAILSVQATIAESLSRGVQRILGVVGGIVLAMLLAHWVGLNSWSLAVLVFVGMGLATRVHLGPQGIPQVAISGLLVMALGSAVPGYAWYRLLETVLGALVALAVSLAIWPPDLTPQAMKSLSLLALGLSDLLQKMQVDLASQPLVHEAHDHLRRARGVAAALEKARSAMNRAELSVRWNPWHQGARIRLKRLKQAVNVLEHVLIQIRGISRTLFVSEGEKGGPPADVVPAALAQGIGDVLALMGSGLRLYAALIDQGDEAAALRLENALRQAVYMRGQIWRDAMSSLSERASAFIGVASVLVDLEKMSQDLSVSSRLLVPLVRVRR